MENEEIIHALDEKGHTELQKIRHALTLNIFILSEFSKSILIKSFCY
jgi:hypothetical protein